MTDEIKIGVLNMPKSLPQKPARETRKNEEKMTPAMGRAMKTTMT